jgi:putative membrane protein
MQIILIIALLIAILAVIFALQNAIPVSITFLVWKTEGSLALVLLVTLAVGAVVGLLVSLPGRIRGAWTAGSQKKKLTELEAGLADYTRKLNEMQAKLQGSTPAKPTERTNLKPPSA